MIKDPLQDGISSVQLIDHMGTDLTVVDAARVSMDKESDWEDEALHLLATGDLRLLDYLARHKHWTPFAHPQIHMRIKMPIFIARQWFKHQIGFNRNEVSRRYVSSEPEIYYPKEWRAKAANVKQGSSEETVDLLSKRIYIDAMGDSVKLYIDMVNAGVCTEQARMVLPQSMYTEFVETGSLAAYARLAKQRLDPHAQKEIQWYAQAVSDIIEPLFPVSWKALTNN